MKSHLQKKTEKRVLLVVIPAVASIVFDFILERLFRRYMSPEDLEREEENDMYAS